MIKDANKILIFKIYPQIPKEKSDLLHVTLVTNSFDRRVA